MKLSKLHQSKEINSMARNYHTQVYSVDNATLLKIKVPLGTFFATKTAPYLRGSWA